MKKLKKKIEVKVRKNMKKNPIFVLIENKITK